MSQTQTQCLAWHRLERQQLHALAAVTGSVENRKDEPHESLVQGLVHGLGGLERTDGDSWDCADAVLLFISAVVARTTGKQQYTLDWNDQGGQII